MSSPGQVVTGIVGGVVGYVIGGPAGAYYGFMIGLAVGGALFPAQIDTARPTHGQLMLQTSTYGGSVPVVFGQRRISGNLLWIGALQTHEHEESSGGKGGKGGGGSISYTYSISMAWALCMGRKTVIRAWAGKDDITEAFAQCATVYDGSQAAADPLIAAAVPRAPAWKNLCYVVLNDYQLGTSPAMPNFTFEVTDVEEWCFNKTAETAGPTDAFHRVLYAGGRLYVADALPTEIKVSKINPETMEVETFVSFPSTDYSLLGVKAGGLIDITGTDRIALAAKRVSADGFYILELSKGDLSVQDRIAVGDVCIGSDENLYVCSHWYSNDPSFAPVTGENWELEWRPLPPDTTIYNLRGYYGPADIIGGAASDCSPLFEGGYYYIPIWGESFNQDNLLKKRRSDGFNEATLGGQPRFMTHGEDGFLYATDGVLMNFHLYKISKETLTIVYDYTVPNEEGQVEDILYEDGYLYYAHRDLVGNYTVTKLSTEDWTEKGSYSCPFGTIPRDLVLMGNFLIVAGGPLTKLWKGSLAFYCANALEPGNGIATDGTSLFVSIQGTGRGVSKFQVSGMGSDVTPQSITRGITTNNLWGLGLDASIWETTKTAAAEAFATEKDLLMSVIFDHQRSVLDALQYILQHHDGFITYMNGQLAHRQLAMEGEAVQFSLSANLSDDFEDGVKGEQWEKIE